MSYIYSFIFAGVVCLIAEIILNNTNLKPGHIICLFVIFGSMLDTFKIYDFFQDNFGAGTSIVITSFGHLIMHGAFLGVKQSGFIGFLNGFFNYTTVGISATIIFAFISSIIFKAKN